MNQQGLDPAQQDMMLKGVIISELVIFVIASLFFAIGNYFLAKRLGKSPVLWAVLTIVPGVNVVFIYYMFYQIIYAILDRLPGRQREAY